MRIVFMGTPEIAVPTLNTLSGDARFRPVAVFSQPPARRSRRGRPEPSPVAAAAHSLDLPVHEVDSVSTGEALERLVELQPDVIVVVAFGQILRQAVLKLPRFGCLNFHPSMLPKFRGAAPVQRAVLEGVVDSGLTIMRLVRKLDAGPILLQRPWRMDESKTAEELLAEAGELGAPLMLEVLEQIETLEAIEQDDSAATFAPPIQKSDGELHFGVPARDVLNRIRATQPWPRAETWLDVGDRGPVRIIVHRAELDDAVGEPGRILAVNQRGIVVACRDGSVCLTSLQLEGKPRKPARDVANGLRLRPGMRFRE